MSITFFKNNINPSNMTLEPDFLFCFYKIIYFKSRKVRKTQNERMNI